MENLQSQQEFKNLINDLEALLNTLRSSDNIVSPDVKGQRRVTHKRYKVTTSNGPLHVDNWKFAEFDFAKKYDSMPCRARGLFTTPKGIVARGYDKFFNVDEFQFVKSEILERECQGPFTVSTKENGCIMFFAGLPDSTLLVCSKNLTGDLESDEAGKLKHYEQGIVAITKQLKMLGKTTHDLAQELYQLGLTAVAELCDDSYEEHVVAYPPEIAGLYLHGLNFNTRDFHTKDMASVTEFATRWGFKKVDYTTIDRFSDLMSYVSGVATLGKHNGREIEGFVVRCKRNEQDFFFKYKFEQPYFLYRQLREATLKLFSDDQKRNIREVLTTYLRFKRITLAYLEFAQTYFAKNPEAQNEFKENRGIISLRQQFLSSLGYNDNQGLALLEMENSESLAERLELLLKESKTVYCVSTIAFPGSGKTTTCMTLANLFSNWSHVQNDNYSNAKAFYSDIVQHFLNDKLVFVDRMNYKRSYRKELFRSISIYRENVIPDVEIKHIGINFMRSCNQEQAIELAKERIILRGDNHQSVKAATSSYQALSLLRDTAKSFERPQLNSDDEELPVSVEGSQLKGYDSEFAFLINVDVKTMDLSLENAKIIYENLIRKFPDLRENSISDEKWLEAYNLAKNYVPTFHKKVSLQSRKPTYYGISICNDLLASLSMVIGNDNTWRSIKESNRVQEKFHVTLAHIQSTKKNASLLEAWNLLGRHFSVNQVRKVAGPMEQKSVKIFADLVTETIVVIQDVLIVVKVLVLDYYKLEDGTFVKLPSNLPHTNEILHITIGTRDQSIRPAESNSYLQTLFESGKVITAGEHVLENFTAHVYDWKKKLEKQQCFIYFQ